MSSQKLSRMECSKEVRRVLNQNRVDLTHCQYVVSGRDIRMTGWLYKTDGSDFSGQQIESLVADFQRRLSGFTVCGDMENWNFSSEHISKVGRHEEEEEDEVVAEKDESQERYKVS